MSGLTIGDLSSIELRDKGREEAERLHEEGFLKKLQAEIVCPACPYDSSFVDDCEGPNLEAHIEGGIIWECNISECPCCDSYVKPPNFTTDLDGKVTS